MVHQETPCVYLERLDLANAEQPVVDMAITRKPGLGSSARNLGPFRKGEDRESDSSGGRATDICYHRYDCVLRS